jgi:CheY-like chemotaxis protein
MTRSAKTVLIVDDSAAMRPELHVPSWDGPDAAPKLRQIAPETPIILPTALADAVSISALKAKGVTRVLPKSELLETLKAEGLFHA